MDCADNTDGPNCEKCKENYYLDPVSNKCVACGCDQTGELLWECHTFIAAICIYPMGYFFK